MSVEVSSAIVVSGDSDLTPGVQAAQGLGIRVHLLSMGPANATSPYLKAEVDQKKHWDDSTVKKFVSPKNQLVAPMPVGTVPGSAPSPAMGPSQLHDCAQSFFDSLTQSQKSSLPQNGIIPKILDVALLATARTAMGRLLTDAEKRELRTEVRRLAAP